MIHKEKKNAVFASIVENQDKRTPTQRPSNPRNRNEQNNTNSNGAGRKNARTRQRGQSFRSSQMKHRHPIKPKKEVSHNIPPIGDNLRIIPLGGVEEIGKNMTVIEYKDDIIIVDAGLQFKEADTPGIDFIIPNVKYLIERKDKIRGLFITHGHLDHIGAIPYIIDQIGNPPIYTRQFGALMIQKRQEEYPHLPALQMKVIDGNEKILIGKHFKVETFPISHTIPSP